MPTRSLYFLRRGAAALALLTLSACGGLPKGGGGAPGPAVTGTERTKLAAIVRPKVAAHPGLSGLHALADAHDALTARVALADTAQRTLDVQYFIWNKDMAGKVMLERILRAADRGVRVRLLLDDLGTMPGDRELMVIDSHPNIEVRMFNPAGMRSMRLLGIAADLARVNKRMHNKSFIADGQVAIVGGRNVGDEYFGADAGANFADLDVAVIGPVVKETTAAFDLYWNHVAAVPIASLSRKTSTPEQAAADRAALLTYCHTAAQSDYAKALREGAFAQLLKRNTVPFQWGRASVVNDHPDKVLTSSNRKETHLSPFLRKLSDQTKHELFLVSPYFVPGKGGVELLTGARQRGLRVVVITNSLASTDGVPVHSGYQRYRKALVEAGVELYEIKPTVASGQKRKSDGGGLFGSGGPSGSSGASLHAKTFAFDRRYGFIGSYNLDPRSSRLNTEMGVLFDCPPLAQRLPKTVEANLDQSAYRVGLEGRHLVWTTREGDKQVRYTNEPETSFGKRLKSSLLSVLPIEGLL